MRPLISLFVLVLTWLSWSGLTVYPAADSPGGVHVDGLLAALGAVSVALVFWLSKRLQLLDSEAQPFHLALGVLRYLPWLMREVVSSNLAIARLILSRKPQIYSHLIRVRASQKTVIGRVIHANTITLTPGTITLDVRNGELLVHALTRSAGDPAQTRIIDQRIVKVEGS